MPSSAKANSKTQELRQSSSDIPTTGESQVTGTLPAAQAYLARILIGVLQLLGMLPIQMRSMLGKAIGMLISMVPTRDRHFGLLQLEATSDARCQLGAQADSSHRVLRRVYANLGRNVLESLNLRPLLSRSDTLFREEQPELITSYLNSGRPIVALTAHFGNWDLFAALMVKRGFPLMVIGREARNPIFQKVLEYIRDAYGVQTLWRSEGPKALKELLGALKSGRTIGALIDQDTRVAGTCVPFLGIPAHTPATLIELARRANAHVVGAVLRREGAGGTIVVEPLDASRPTEEVLLAFHKFLERQIAQAPEQWVWIHKRWRTLPDGTRESSKAYESRLRTLCSRARSG